MRSAHCAHFQGLAEDEFFFPKAHRALRASAQRTVSERKHNTQRNLRNTTHNATHSITHTTTRSAMHSAMYSTTAQRNGTE